MGLDIGQGKGGIACGNLWGGEWKREGGVSWSASFMLIEGNLGNTAVKGNSQSCRLFVYRKSL